MSESEYVGYNPEDEFDQPKSEEITPAHAQSIFENKVITTINKELPKEQRISSSDGSVSLDWFFDEKTLQGHFAIVRRRTQDTLTEEEMEKKKKLEQLEREYVLETDKKTGKKTDRVEKMPPGAFQPHEETPTVYDLDTSKVRKMFHRLEPMVRKSFIEGWEESLVENTALIAKYSQAFKKEKRAEKKADLKIKIDEQELAREKIEKMLKVLE